MNQDTIQESFDNIVAEWRDPDIQGHRSMRKRSFKELLLIIADFSLTEENKLKTLHGIEEMIIRDCPEKPYMVESVKSMIKFFRLNHGRVRSRDMTVCKRTVARLIKSREEHTKLMNKYLSFKDMKNCFFWIDPSKQCHNNMIEEKQMDTSTNHSHNNSNIKKTQKTETTTKKPDTQTMDSKDNNNNNDNTNNTTYDDDESETIRIDFLMDGLSLDHAPMQP